MKIKHLLGYLFLAFFIIQGFLYHIIFGAPIENETSIWGFIAFMAFPTSVVIS